jgi:hypothetical protein
LYFGYDIVQVQKYSRNAARFIETEAVFPNDYLLKRTIDAKKQSILLTYGGEKISQEQIELLKQKLQNYGLQNSILEVRQGFAYLGDSPENEQVNQLSKALAEKDNEISKLKAGLDSSKSNESDLIQLRREIKALYPNLSAVSVSPIVILDSLNQKTKIQLVYAKYSRRPDKKEELQLESWLAVKFRNRIKLIVDK